MLHICLVEDNEELGDLVQQALVDAWYICDWYQSVEQITASKAERYHIFLLDVMLPWKTWFDYAEQLRVDSHAGIIFLSAKSSLDDKKQWFTVWADDYVTKPFSMEELILRITALAERLEPTHYFKLREVVIDWKWRLAKKEWKHVHLTPIEREVVWCLLRNRWTICRRADLIEYVWGTDAMFGMNRSLDVAITNIRKKLWKEFIETLPGIWYQLWTKR